MKISPSTGSLKSTSASSMASEDSLDACNFPDYEDLVFVKNLSEAKFPVYLVEDRKTEHQYAMKVFQWEKDSPSLFFMREVRFAQIESPNVIQFINYEFEKEHQTESGVVKFSYILMEYAPYGDFFDVLITAQVPFDETLIRTYFHQLVKAIEDVHSQGAAHLDIKLENLLMNRDFKLKLTDFDLGCMGKEEKVKTKGTKNFRAPEVLDGTCNNPQAADIFSMGVLLFILRTGGMIPYNEDQSAKCLTFEEFKKINPKTFWEKQCIILKKSASFFSEDFKSLFIWMTRPEPEERPTLAQIKRSKWYRREIYSEEEVAMFMQNRLEPKE